MSVINNVLKDLDNKSSAFTPLELADLAGTEKKRSLKAGSILSAILLFVIVVLVFLMYFKLPQVNLENNEFLIETVEGSIDKEEETESSEFQGKLPILSVSDEMVEIEVVGLQMNESSDFLELTLQLPQGAQGLLKETSDKQYVFLISNLSSQIIVPDFNNNIWLRGVSTKETAGGIEIYFNTMDKVLVETRHSQKEQGYYWKIRFKKAQKEDTVNRQNSNINSVLKSPVLPPVEQLLLSKTAAGTESTGVYNVQADTVVEQAVKLEITPVIDKITDEGKFNKAQIAIQRQNWSAAQIQLESLLGSSLDKKARVILITLLKRQKKSDEMKLLLSRSLELYPHDIDFLVMDADMLFSEKQYLTLLNRYNNKTQNKYIINFVAASFQGISQYDNAINSYQLSLKIDPQQPRQWINLAISQEHVSQYERAMQAYQMALNSGPVNSRLQSFIHNRLQQLSDRRDQNR